MTPALTNALAALASRLTVSGDYEAVDVIDTATARIARLEEALREALGYVEHWQADVRCNLKPTVESLATAHAEISAALGSDAG